MAHERMADTPEELEAIAANLRKRIEDMDKRRDLLVEELKKVEEKRARLLEGKKE